MKKYLAPILFLALLLGPAAAARAHDHDHSHDEAAAPAQLSLNKGQKWATDDALRQAMGRIRTELAASQGGKGTQEQQHALGNKVNEQIAFLMQNCKLDKEADAMLHLILAEIIAGADALTGQDGDRARAGADKIGHALKNYATYFEHPGW